MKFLNKRNSMKQLIYQVYTGKQSNLYDHCTDSVKAYADRIGADHIIQTEPILRLAPDIFATNRSKESYQKYGGFLPIYEKENAFDYFDRYDQIAIIDADIWIRPGCDDSIFDAIAADADFAGVLERDMPLTPQYERKVANYARMQYGMPGMQQLFDWKCPRGLGADFYNMGMMVLNHSFSNYLKGQTAKQFLDRMEFKDFIDGKGAWKWSTDQTLLNYFVKKEKMKVTNLSYHWNALYKGVDDSVLGDANFIHFFLKDKLPARGENIEELMKDVS